ncbi:MAG: hypothetical protein QOI00_1134, partial [Chloroflexota bacterium]|nr:hypothetical protein [Chloroflexota bacterium]
MSERVELTDGAIQAMLTARADRAARFRLDPAAIVTAAGPRASRYRPDGSFVGGVFIAASGIAAAMIVAILVGSSLLTKPGGTGVPTDSSSTVTASTSASEAASPSLTPPAVGLRVLSAGEAGELIRSQSAARAGTLMVVNGSLIAGETVVTHCASGPCGSTLLADAGGGFVVRPVGDIGPGPWSASGPGRLSGTFVLRLNAAIDNHLRIVDFIGALTTPPNGGPAWFVQDLLEGAAHTEGAYAAVDGWLVRDPLHPCASDPRNPVVAYGCPSDDWLTEDEFQPLQADGSSIGPRASILLSSGSYDRWAPDPAPAGLDGRGVEPRHAIYLLWLVSDGCGPNADCATPPPRWRIVGRFDPLPGPSPSALPSATVAHTVAELVADPKSFINQNVDVAGWLVATPPLKCLGAGPYSCSEVDWITDESFQPWVSDGQTGSTRAPVVGIRVQNGAYDAFAPSPAISDFGARTPRLGDWTVR